MFSDGSWLVYVSYPDGILWRSRADASERIRLTYPPMTVNMPHFSPDAKRIVFSGKIPGQPWNLVQVSADGGMPEKLTHSPSTDLDPSYAADGQRVAFSRDFSSIQLLDVSTQQLRTVPGSAGLCCPRWSRDGQHRWAPPCVVAVDHCRCAAQKPSLDLARLTRRNRPRLQMLGCQRARVLTNLVLKQAKAEYAKLQ